MKTATATATATFLLFCVLAPSLAMADRPLKEALEEAKTTMTKSNPTAELFLPAVSERSFLAGLEYGMEDYEDWIRLNHEDKNTDHAKFEKSWRETYKPIYQKILETRMLPDNVKIGQMKHNVRVARASPNRTYCDSKTKHPALLDLRLDIGKISDTELGFSLPILRFELGSFL